VLLGQYVGEALISFGSCCGSVDKPVPSPRPIINTWHTIRCIPPHHEQIPQSEALSYKQEELQFPSFRSRECQKEKEKEKTTPEKTKKRHS
jgi:hypothetical protein